MTIFVIEYETPEGTMVRRIAKRNVEEAVKWFKENYHRQITAIYHQ